MHLREVDANLLVTLDALLVDASVTRAAVRLGRSASAISHALAKLREIFADELFVRAGQKLVPTAKALELAPTVHVILAGMESLLRPSKPFDPSDAMRDFAVAASEAGELMLLQPLRQRLDTQAPNMRVDWMRVIIARSNIDALRHGGCHFVDRHRGCRSSGARHPRTQAVRRQARHAGAAQPSVGEAARPRREQFASADHIEVNSLPAIALIDRKLEAGKLACNVSSRVSSVLVGLLLALNSDALLTLPASLASILETQFGLVRIAQPVRHHRLSVKADVAFEL